MALSYKTATEAPVLESLAIEDAPIFEGSEAVFETGFSAELDGSFENDAAGSVQFIPDMFEVA